jgi:hypothetical protein
LEVSLAVADYFEMLRAELTGLPVNKTEHRRNLSPRLEGRSNGSIEFKHQNISAVLVNMGLPYISGYKPRGNYQALLGDGVGRFIEGHPTFFDELATTSVLDPPALPSVPTADLRELFEPPPDRIVVPQFSAEPWRSRRGRQIDFARRDAENRRLGRLGEEFVISVERRRLAELGRDDLASKVEWVAQTRGDGLGFDVLSFDERDETDRLVEVKTTGLGKFFPFYVTVNEVRCSEATMAQYHLYRVFDFGQSPRLYALNGPLSSTLRLDPVQYRASI